MRYEGDGRFDDALTTINIVVKFKSKKDLDERENMSFDTLYGGSVKALSLQKSTCIAEEELA